MREYVGFLVVLMITLILASLMYVMSGQYATAIAMLIGMFPVVMSMALTKR